MRTSNKDSNFKKKNTFQESKRHPLISHIGTVRNPNRTSTATKLPSHQVKSHISSRLYTSKYSIDSKANPKQSSETVKKIINDPAKSSQHVHQQSITSLNSQDNLETKDEFDLVALKGTLYPLFDDLGVTQEYKNNFKTFIHNTSDIKEKNFYMQIEINELEKLKKYLIKLNKNINYREQSIILIQECDNEYKNCPDSNNGSSEIINKVIKEIKHLRVYGINIVNYYQKIREIFCYNLMNCKFNIENFKNEYFYDEYYLMKMKFDLEFLTCLKLNDVFHFQNDSYDPFLLFLTNKDDIYDVENDDIEKIDQLKKEKDERKINNKKYIINNKFDPAINTDPTLINKINNNIDIIDHENEENNLEDDNLNTKYYPDLENESISIPITKNIFNECKKCNHIINEDLIYYKLNKKNLNSNPYNKSNSLFSGNNVSNSYCNSSFPVKKYKITDKFKGNYSQVLFKSRKNINYLNLFYQSGAKKGEGSSLSSFNNSKNSGVRKNSGNSSGLQCNAEEDFFLSKIKEFEGTKREPKYEVMKEDSEVLRELVYDYSTYSKNSWEKVDGTAEGDDSYKYPNNEIEKIVTSSGTIQKRNPSEMDNNPQASSQAENTSALSPSDKALETSKKATNNDYMSIRLASENKNFPKLFWYKLMNKATILKTNTFYRLYDIKQKKTSSEILYSVLLSNIKNYLPSDVHTFKIKVAVRININNFIRGYSSVIDGALRKIKKIKMREFFRKMRDIKPKFNLEKMGELPMFKYSMTKDCSNEDVDKIEMMYDEVVRRYEGFRVFSEWDRGNNEEDDLVKMEEGTKDGGEGGIKENEGDDNGKLKGGEDNVIKEDEQKNQEIIKEENIQDGKNDLEKANDEGNNLNNVEKEKNEKEEIDKEVLIKGNEDKEGVENQQAGSLIKNNVEEDKKDEVINEKKDNIKEDNDEIVKKESIKKEDKQNTKDNNDDAEKENKNEGIKEEVKDDDQLVLDDTNNNGNLVGEVKEDEIKDNNKEDNEKNKNSDVKVEIKNEQVIDEVKNDENKENETNDVNMDKKDDVDLVQNNEN